MSSRGKVIAASANTASLVPTPPDEAILIQVRYGGTYVGLDPIDELGLLLRVVANIANPAPGQEPRFVQGPVSGRRTGERARDRGAYRVRALSRPHLPARTAQDLLHAHPVAGAARELAERGLGRRVRGPPPHRPAAAHGGADPFGGGRRLRDPDRGRGRGRDRVPGEVIQRDDAPAGIRPGRGPGQPPPARRAADIPRSGVVAPVVGGAHHRPRRTPGDVQPDGEGHPRRPAGPADRDCARPSGREGSAARPVRACGGDADPRRPAGLARGGRDRGSSRAPDPDVPGHRAPGFARGRPGACHRFRRRYPTHRGAAQPGVGGSRTAPRTRDQEPADADSALCRAAPAQVSGPDERLRRGVPGPPDPHHRAAGGKPEGHGSTRSRSMRAPRSGAPVR